MMKKYDVIAGYNNLKFEFSWIFESSSKGIYLESIAQYLTSAIGLLDNRKCFLVDFLKEFKNKYGKFPSSCENFLKEFLDFLNRKENQYGSSPEDIFKVNKNRIEVFIDCDRFYQVLEGSSTIPQWFVDWINPKMGKGKRIKKKS